MGKRGFIYKKVRRIWIGKIGSRNGGPLGRG